jgi:hypothetical protein
MACTAVDVLQDEVLLVRAKVDHQARGAHALCLPVAGRTGSAPQDVRVNRGGQFIVRSGELGQTNFLGSLLNLERVFRPEYLLADHQRPVDRPLAAASVKCTSGGHQGRTGDVSGISWVEMMATKLGVLLRHAPSRLIQGACDYAEGEWVNSGLRDLL